MVGSSFILILKNGRRKLLNTSRIVAVHNEDILLKGINRKIFWEFPPEQEMVYTVQIDMGGTQNLQYMFDKAEERDELLDQLIAAISPSATLDSAPGMPATWAELAKQGPPSPEVKPPVDSDGMTLEELRPLAMAQLKLLKEQAALYTQSLATPPAAKPPRKSRTKKGEE